MARQIIKEPIDNKPIKEQDPIGHILNALDRCDRCSAQAYVMVKGSTGELLFCGHHYNKAMDNPEGYKNMMSFAISILDERDKLIENKSKGENY